MKEKLRSLKLIVKNDRRIWFASGFILLVFLFMQATPKPQKAAIIATTAVREG